VTSPGDLDGLPVTLPAAQARQVLVLLGTCEHVVSALRARGLRGDATTLASLEELAALLTAGGDAAQLATRLDAAQRELAAAMTARQAP
jgi:hypothetical protein